MPSSRVLSRLPRRLMLALAVLVVMALPVGLLPPVSYSALAGPSRERPGVQKQRGPVKGRPGKVRPRKADPAAKAAVRSVPGVSWPKPGAVDVAVDPESGSKTTAGGLPIVVTKPHGYDRGKGRARGRDGGAVPGKVRVEVLDWRSAAAAFVPGGVLMRVRGTDAPAKASVGLTLDYSSFASAFGGNYGAHLRVFRLPACALTTPKVKGCLQPVALPSSNDPTRRTLSVDVAVEGNASARKAPAPADGATPAPSGSATPRGTAGSTPGASSVPSPSKSPAAVTDRPTPSAGNWTRVSGASAASTAAEATGTLLVVAAAEESGQGNYGATDLAPSSKWSVDPSSGAFSWSYPMRTPPVPGGLAPQVGLNYSSQTVDGRTATTNNQGSWVGEGFSYETGFIERRYKACADDGHTTVGDLCWGTDNAVLQLGGKSGELVKDSATGQWRLKNDDGSKIEKLTGTANGANDGEYWRVTTTDGTQYYFGLNRLPGWSAGKEETNAAWTLPVFGDDSGEPCYDATFANAWCNQAWRWNLDYVKDRHGNVLSHFYAREYNHYARNAKTDVNGTQYHRGGYLKRSDYGQKDGQVYAALPSARVEFTTAERCLPADGVTCSETADPTSAHWPDVPGWLNCKADTKCTWQQTGPSFWTRKRLTKITTQIRSGSAMNDVESWSLTHLFTDNGDGSKTLWLSKVDHAGHVGGTAAMPSVDLNGIQLPNRVDVPGDNIQPMVRFRLATVYTDTGGQVDVNYAPTECTSGSLPTPGNSTKRCFPVKWNPPGVEDPITDWFHKYVVERVIETDRTGGSPDQVTKYTYVGDAGWRHSDPDGISDPKYLTWGEWAGYGKVQVRGGDGLTFTTRTDHTYLRGLHGDKDPAGGTRSVSVQDSTSASHVDHADLAGFELEAATYDGAEVINKEITTPWRQQTASRTNSWGTDRAGFVLPEVIREFTAVGSGWRETKATTSYDATTGRATQIDDLVDVSTAADDKCTRNFYADNVGAWMRSYIKQVEVYTASCSGTLNKATQLISDTLTSYDGGAHGAAPAKGDITKVQTIKHHDGTTGEYITAVESTFDGFGRPLTVKDAAGSTTTTAYTDTDGLATKKVETSPLGHVTETYYAPAWGQPTGQLDPNGKRMDLDHDPLGRLVRVWLPDRSKASGMTPSIKYTYLVRRDDVTAIKTEKIENGGSYGTEYKIFDGLLRPRQMQAEGPDGGRLVADTFYNSTGKVSLTNATYYMTGAPADRLETVPNGSVNGQTAITYDGAGRPTAEIFQVAGDERWRTTTTYEGDRTHVDPPAGGTPTTTIVDAQGRKTQLLQYKGDSPTGAADTTTYAYEPAGQLKTVTDAAGNIWSYEYDRRGRKTKLVDPDAGTTTYSYDDLDRPILTTDGRGKSIFTTYDVIGRRTATYEGTDATGTKLTALTYDTKYKGHLYSSVRYVGGNTAKPYGTVFVYRDEFYRPTTTRYVVPDTEGNLKGPYNYTTSYNRDGTVNGIGIPAAGGLPAESIAYGYDALQRPTTVTGINSYVTDTTYAPTGEVLQYELSTAPGAKKTWLTYAYEKGTNRLKESKVDRETVGAPDYRAGYDYDLAGNVRSIADAATSDNQCFTYDYLRRLSQAWTAKTDCVTAPTAANVESTVGGPEPYWQSYTYDVTGNRTESVKHALTTGGQDSTTAYTYPTTGQARPHAVTQSLESTPQGDRLNTFAYDASGNTTERVLAGSKQTLTWNSEGTLDTVTEASGQTTNHVYDAEGNRLLRRETGSSTLYLPGMELKLNTSTGVVEATRYYSHGDSVIATRTKDGVTFLAADHHGTALIAVKNDAAQTLTRRRVDPFGDKRSGQQQQPAWIDDKGFLGKTKDPSGLTHIGAREYDPSLGRFISVDPVMDHEDPQSWNGYAYANSNPATYSDPTGLFWIGSPQWWQWLRDTINKVVNYVRKAIAAYRNWYNSPAAAAARAARQRAEMAKQRLIGAAKQLGKIAADELGITDALDCFTTGDLAACGETAVTVLGSLVGAGVVTKLVKRYGAPWKWDDAWRKAKKVKNLIDEMIETFQDWRLARKAAEFCKRPPNSFLPSTRVLMANGRMKPISKVKVGDNVVATDPKTGKTSTRVVAATIIGQGQKSLVEITLASGSRRGDSAAKVVATGGHPFWATAVTSPPLRLATTSGWVDAADLAPGMWLRAPEGNHVKIAGIRAWSQQQDVYNLTVGTDHTYYVEAGDTSVLVHNDDTPIDLNGKSRTVWLRGPYRIDIEARDGTKQMHFQVQIKGVKSGDAPKYQYNPETGDFDGMPKSLRRDLAKNYPDYKKGFSKAIGEFGRVIGTCP